jgi:hypothetical protein
MHSITLERFGQLLETGVIGFGLLWAACALALAL